MLISNGDNGFKEMDMGKQNANKTYYDICGHIKEEVKTNEDGRGTFLVNGESVSVWVGK